MIDNIAALALAGGVVFNSVTLWLQERQIRALRARKAPAPHVVEVKTETSQEEIAQAVEKAIGSYSQDLDLTCKRWHVTDQALLDGAFLNYLDLMVQYAKHDKQAAPGDLSQLKKLRDAVIRVERYKESTNRKYQGNYKTALDHYTKERLAKSESLPDNDGE